MAMMLPLARIMIVAALVAVSTPAAAQVQVVVDGRMQDVPAGVVRTISYAPGGQQIIRDEPFNGQTAPGYATITTTETTDSDEDGSDARTTIVTRIEPMAVSAVAYAPAIPAPTMVQASSWAQPSSYDVPASDGPPQMMAEAQQPDYAPQPAPRLDVDPATFEPAAADGQEKVLHIRRDPMTGHFIATVVINGVKLRAIVDTGAQETVLSARDARASGADRDIVRSTPMSGIGGTTMLNVARVRTMDVGGQHLGSFTACIGAEGIPYTLLGQTEINRLGRIVIEDGVMTITPRSMMMASR